MKVITWETLYYEDHGATLKHKCGKRIVTLSLLSFSLIFFLFYLVLFSFLWPLFFLSFFLSFFIFRPESHPDLWGNHSLHHPFPHLGQCSKNEDHHTFIFLQLNNYNSILRTKYDSIWMPPAVYRDMQWFVSDMYERIMKGGFCHKYDVNYMIMLAIWQWWSMS